MSDQKMKAVQIHDFGGPEVLAHDTVERPRPRPTDVVVRIKSVGVNPHDLKARDGTLKDRDYKTPLILGWEIAGIVEETGTHTFHLKPGDEVFGYSSMNRPGGYAEFIAVDEGSLALKPVNISFEEAAAFPVGALTSFQGLFGHGRLKHGQTCLVHAGSGAVGSQGVQLAALEGATVYATASGIDVNFVRSLGASKVIDYREQDFTTILSQVDVVLDLVGGNNWRRSLKVMKPSGHLVSVMMETELLEEARVFGVTGHLYIVEPSGAELERIAGYIEDGKLTARVDRVFPMTELQEAHRYLETGRARGKVVVSADF